MISFAKRERAQKAAACIGVDAGKFTHTLVVRPRGQADTRPFTTKTRRASYDEAAAFIQSHSGRPEESLVGIEFAGNYGFTFAHYLAERGYPIVSVLPAHTKRWKEVAHNQPLKTDAKDAATITDLLTQGHFVSFPFLKPEYARLRYLSAGRERLSLLRRGGLTQLRTILQVVFPEFEDLFDDMSKPTPLALLANWPAPQDILKAPRRKVIALMRRLSRGQHGLEAYERLIAAAKLSLGLPTAQWSLRGELELATERLEMYRRHIEATEQLLVEALEDVPEAPYLMSIPKLGPVTAAIFLGAIGDPQSYQSGYQILRVAGLSLVERSSGILRGQKRLSKRGRPLLRQAAYMFAVRSIRKGGLFRAEYEGLLSRNGGQAMKALGAVMRSSLRLMYSVARDQRMFTEQPPSAFTRRRSA